MRMALACTALLALEGCANLSAGPLRTETVALTVVGPPVAVEDTARSRIYEITELANGEASGGRIEQQWAMLGREDRSARVPGSDEYEATTCPAGEGSAIGMDLVLDALVARATLARVVIINESHHVTAHRDFSQRLLERLRPIGYTAFAAETFANRDGQSDPVETFADLAYPHVDEGWYSSEPVFGRLLRTAKVLGFRLAAYEQVDGLSVPIEEDIATRIARREQAQAENIATILKGMRPDEKLMVHVGYSHASEQQNENADRSVWMAGRLKRLTGIDPLTIDQTICRGGAETIRLLPMPDDGNAPFDFVVDHPLMGFRYGRAAWRFNDGVEEVAIPTEFRNANELLVIEAFAEGEPFDAVPMDRVYVEPGEDIRLALPPGRYTVRAIRLAE